MSFSSGAGSCSTSLLLPSGVAVANARIVIASGKGAAIASGFTGDYSQVVCTIPKNTSFTGTIALSFIIGYIK